MRIIFSFFLSLCWVGFVQAQSKLITLEDIWKKGTFQLAEVPGFYTLNDGTRFTRAEHSDGRFQIKMYDLESGNLLETLFDSEIQTYEGKKLKPSHYSFSKDEQSILLFTERKPLYRHSSYYRVYLYDLKTKKLKSIHSEPVLHASFSPDGSKIAFVKDNNMYYTVLATGETIAMTRDGKKNEIINGNCDWVYEEEFSFTQAYAWSPDGKYIAYYKFDESKVPQYSMTLYKGLYPEAYTYKYPKAGEPNAVVSIHIYELATSKTITVNTGEETDIYIPRIKWMPKDLGLCVYRLNRHQNHLELLRANTSTGHTEVIYEEKNACYIEIHDNLHFLPDGSSFLFTSEQEGYMHVYRWDWNKRKLTQLSKGKYDVESLVAVDESTETVFFTAAVTPLTRQLFSVNWNGKALKQITRENGTHDITAIKGNKYFLDKFSTLNTPPVFMLRDRQGNVVRTLEDNSKLREKIKEYKLGKLYFDQFPGAEEGVLLNAWVITPPDFSPENKYPVMMYQYSGPGSQQVADRFPVGNYFWHQMLAQKGYVIVCVDGTGTGFRGEAFKKKTYLQLGKYESEDQIAVAKYLAKQSWVDKDRIGIWGWSYGGFMSSTCLLKGNDVFKAAIAVAPVTNWRYYDNIYTERYMRTPRENEKGYDDNAPEKMADRLKGKLLLIHGTADDNVHLQNAIMLSEALIKADKDFDSEYYPDKNHGIYGGNTRYHLYKRMTNFILENL